MNKKLATILSVVLVLLAGGVVVIPHVAQAAGDCSWWLIFSPNSLAECATISIFDSLFSQLGNWVLKLMSYAISLSGIILNASIVLTLNIKALYEATPAIEQTWVVIRNISSIFVIFALLYASINTILGTKGPQFGSLVVKIFFAGILINFSLFFTRVLIDASNLVSLQFYKAIAPNSQNVDLSKADIGAVLTNSFKQGGISDVFQQSLKIPKVYNKGGILATANGTFLVAVSTIGGSILMLTAALSFLFAGFAFIIRIVVLLLAMGFSPLYFVGMIFPKVDQKMTSKFMEYFIPQLTFMPAYLFFMYVALKFLSNGGFFDALDKAQLAAAKAGSAIGAVVVADAGLIFQFIIAFVFINLPLIAAIQLGGHSTDLANSAKGWVKGKVGGVAGRNTLGRLGKLAGKGFDNLAASNFTQNTAPGKFAASALRKLDISQAVRGGIQSIESSKYGSKQNLGDIKKEDKDRARVISGVQRTNLQNKIIADTIGKSTPPTPAQLIEFRKSVAGMDAKEIEELDTKVLMDPVFASALPSSKFDALIKGTALSPQQQSDLKRAREAGFEGILNGSGADHLLNTVLKGKPQDIAKLPSSVITNPLVAVMLDPASLRKMIDENVGQADRDRIRNAIDTHVATLTAAGTPPAANSQLGKAHNYLNAGPGQTLF